MNKQYQICTRCVMDTSDPDISFNEQGVCNYCNNYDNEMSRFWYRGKAGEDRMNQIVSKIKEQGKGKEYDCIIGLSGGVDSSYLAYIGKQLGLRMLAVHVDAGWNSELAVQNIQNICTKLDIDLITEVIDWSVMRKVQLAFLRSGLVNQDIPQDHAFFAALYKYAEKNNIKYVLNGYNIATENTLPLAWRGPAAMDATLVRSVYKYYNKESIKNFPLLGYWKLNYLNNYLKKFVIVDLLNCLNYSKDEALRILKEKVDYKDYGGKHNESRFTKFHQNYFLIKKYGFEKRRAHLASLVISGLMNREQALVILKKPVYETPQQETEDVEYIAKKLGLGLAEFDSILKEEPRRLEFFLNRARSFIKNTSPY